MVLIFLLLAGCQAYDASPAPGNSETNVELSEGEPDRDRIKDGNMGEEPGMENIRVEEDGSYSGKEEVVEYIEEVSEEEPDSDRIKDGNMGEEPGMENTRVEENGSYSSKDEVAEYINEFSSLPPNYITKKDAQKLGWVSSEGNLWEVTDQKSIGGDYFGNREGLLPNSDGRKYYECDINYNGGYRGAERIVFSNDGLIFYTSDHYESFKQLY